MSKDADSETIALIISIVSKYIIASVVLISMGVAIGVYAILSYVVYGSSITFVSGIAVFLVLFFGLTLIAVGVFLTLRSLYWMRSEGVRLREKLEKSSSKGSKGGKGNDS